MGFRAREESYNYGISAVLKCYGEYGYSVSNRSDLCMPPGRFRSEYQGTGKACRFKDSFSVSKNAENAASFYQIHVSSERLDALSHTYHNLQSPAARSQPTPPPPKLHSRVRRRADHQFPDEDAVRQVLREVRLAQRQLLDDGRRQRQHRNAQVPAAGRRERRTLSWGRGRGCGYKERYSQYC